MNKKNVCKGGLVSFFVVFILLAGVAVHAQEVKKIALLPFSVHAPSEPQVLHEKVFGSLVRELKKSSLIQVVSAGRVAGTETGEPVSEAKAMAVGKSLGVDYVLGGSISQFGNIISIDVRIYDIAQQTMIPGFSIQGRGTETLSTSVQQVKTAILAKINVVQRISRIEFRGNRKIGAGAIEQKIKSERGGVFFEETLAEDIRAIYKMGYFDDVQADVEDSPEGKVIAFLLQEKALVSEIVIKGNKEVSTSDIEGVLTIKVRQTLNTEKLRRGHPDQGKRSSLYPEDQLRRESGLYDERTDEADEYEGEGPFPFLFGFGPSEEGTVEAGCQQNYGLLSQ